MVLIVAHPAGNVYLVALKRVSSSSGSLGFLRHWSSSHVARILKCYNSTVTFCSDIGGRFDSFVDLQVAKVQYGRGMSEVLLSSDKPFTMLQGSESGPLADKVLKTHPALPLLYSLHQVDTPSNNT